MEVAGSQEFGSQERNNAIVAGVGCLLPKWSFDKIESMLLPPSCVHDILSSMFCHKMSQQDDPRQAWALYPGLLVFRAVKK